MAMRRSRDSICPVQAPQSVGIGGKVRMAQVGPIHNAVSETKFARYAETAREMKQHSRMNAIGCWAQITAPLVNSQALHDVQASWVSDVGIKLCIHLTITAAAVEIE